MLWEERNEYLDAGIAESDLDRIMNITRRRWNYYIAVGNDPELENSSDRDAINAELAAIRATVPLAEQAVPETLRPYEEKFYSEFAADAGYDPRPYLEMIDVPMIYVFGETDVNVPTQQSVEFLETFRETYDKDIEIVVYRGVGHPLANWTGVLTAGYVPAYLDLLESWMTKQVQR